MNPVTDMLFTIIWFSLLVFAIRSLIRGWSIMKEVPSQDYSVEKRTVTKLPHPEMTDVKQGDELLVVKFGGEEKKDPLLQSLENRINELEDPWEEDDEDDDNGGDVIVRR